MGCRLCRAAPRSPRVRQGRAEASAPPSCGDEAVIKAPKRGFGIPVGDGCVTACGTAGRDRASSRLFSAGIVEPPGYRAVVAEHQSGTSGPWPAFWALLMLDAFLARSEDVQPPAGCLTAVRILYHHRLGSKDGQYVHVEEIVSALGRLDQQVQVVGPTMLEQADFGGGSCSSLR